MANNRLYLKCERCGERRMLGKRMAAGYYQPVDAEKLQAFFDAHEWCDPSPDGQWLSTTDVFALEYEIGRGEL